MTGINITLPPAAVKALQQLGAAADKAAAELVPATLQAAWFDGLRTGIFAAALACVALYIVFLRPRSP